MLGGIDTAHVYIVCGYTDIRHSIDGLAAIIKQNFGCNPYDGRIAMTNNRAERAVKPFVIARKNFLFSDTSRGAEASALCFSMIESAKLNNLNLYGYLIYLFSELPKLGENPPEEQLNKFLPWSKELPSYCKKA